MTCTSIIYNFAATHCIHVSDINLFSLLLSAGQYLWPHAIRNYSSKIWLISGNMLKVKFSEEFFSVQVPVWSL